MLIVPPWTSFNIVFYISLAVMTVIGAYSDYHGWLGLQYSKFSTGRGIPSRVGMFIIYFLPIVMATAAAWSYLPDASVIQLAVYLAVSLHFAKRVLETLFLHKYSGTIEVLTLVFIIFIYSFIAGTICFLNAQAIPAMDAWFYMGMLLLVIGEAGNFYHHKLLADLRKNGEGYHVPQGGWFRYVACPHYLFELIAWLGIFLMSRHLFTLLAFFAMFAYLVERSV
ncbi:MAG: DUF1295 domain-containing protein, partial [Chloroflexota bacterium]